MTDDLKDLASEIIGPRVQPLVRTGTITDTDLAGTPPTVEVDGRPMRFDDSISSPTVGDVVYWFAVGAAPIVGGRLAT